MKAYALYEDDENPLQWYECVVDEIVPPKEEWDRPSYVVTFLEYGNTETVTLGMIDFKPSTLETDEELTAKVVAIDRKGVEATGRDYARVPLGLKKSLASQMEGSGGGSKGGREAYRPPTTTMAPPPPPPGGGGGGGLERGGDEGGGKKRARTQEEEARAEEKRRKLREMYG